MSTLTSVSYKTYLKHILACLSLTQVYRYSTQCSIQRSHRIGNSHNPGTRCSTEMGDPTSLYAALKRASRLKDGNPKYGHHMRMDGSYVTESSILSGNQFKNSSHMYIWKTTTYLQSVLICIHKYSVINNSVINLTSLT